MKDDTKLSPVEQTGKQDLTQAIVSGLFSTPWAAGYGGGVVTAGGNFPISGGGTVGNGLNWGCGPFAALQGSGAAEGTNRYSSMMGPSGALPFGLIPGFPSPWPGTYTNYRVMAAHPTLAMALGCIIGPIVAGEWTVEATPDAPAKAKEFIEELYLPMRLRVVTEMLKSLSFGWRGFERVVGWKKVAGGRHYVTTRLKPLLPELSEILVNESGHLAGIRQGDIELPNDPNTVGGTKAVVYAYDKDGDYWYGCSLMENCRRAWSNWLCVDDNLFRLGTKAASIIPYVGYPPGEGKDADGKSRSNYESAVAIAQAMSNGRGVVFPNFATLGMGDLESILQQLPKLASASLWHHGTIDMGNSGPSQMAMIEQLKYYDMLLVRGCLQPERSLLESRHGGSKADSESHGDHSTNYCDFLHGDITGCVSEQSVNADLAENFGPDAIGTVKLKAVPLIDDKKIVDDKLLDAVANNPQALMALLERMDMGDWMDRAGFKKRDDMSDDELEHWDDLMLPPDPASTGTDAGPPTNDARKNGRDGGKPRETIRLSFVDDGSEKIPDSLSKMAEAITELSAAQSRSESTCTTLAAAIDRLASNPAPVPNPQPLTLNVPPLPIPPPPPLIRTRVVRDDKGLLVGTEQEYV